MHSTPAARVSRHVSPALPLQAQCAKITASKIYLCDTGGQYLDGTTDITRTVHFGTPSEVSGRMHGMIVELWFWLNV